MKTTELSGVFLDWAVTKAEGLSHDFDDEGSTIPNVSTWGCHGWATSWEMGGPIIEREKIECLYDGVSQWYVDAPHGWYEGPTPLIAAMRCYVASQFGDEIEIPEQLMEGV